MYVLFEERENERKRESVCVVVGEIDNYVERKVAIRTDNAQILSFRNILTRKDT